jgi:hypothetical protein
MNEARLLMEPGFFLDRIKRGRSPCAGTGSTTYGALAPEAAVAGGIVVVVVVLLVVVSVPLGAGVVVVVVLGVGVVAGGGVVVLLGVVVVVVLVVVSSFLPQAEKASEALSAATRMLRRVRDVCMLRCSCWGNGERPHKRPMACPSPHHPGAPRLLHPFPSCGHVNVSSCDDRNRMLRTPRARLR